MGISDWSSDVCASDLRDARRACTTSRCLDFARHERAGEVRHDIADDRQRMLVILGEMVDDPRPLRVQVAAAVILGADFLARRGLDQRRAGEEDRALTADDDGLVAHRGDISAARGARSEEHTSELQSLMRISYAVFCLKK